MICAFIYLFTFLFGLTVNAMIIDLQSIYMDPDLHRLCWRQFEEISTTKYITLGGSPPEINEIEENNQKIYCLRNNNKADQILNIKVEEGVKSEDVQLNVNFFIPLAPPMQVIRMKVFHNKVYFHLNNEFAGLQDFSSQCQVLVTYKTLDNQPELKKHVMNKLFPNYSLEIESSEPFNVYYTCKFEKSWTSSAFIFEQGSTFSVEKFGELKPVIIFPFRRFLITKWDSPINIPKAYIVVIYETFQRNVEKCLKIFRLFSESIKTQESYEAKPLIPVNCYVNVTIEDLGYYNEKSNKSIYAVLDMMIPLKFRKRYKLFISWRDPLNEVRDNYIFFEPLPNLNSGNININCNQFESINFDKCRNEIHPILQNEISNFNEVNFNNTSQNRFSFRAILPILSSQNPPKIEIRNDLIQPNSTELEQKCFTVSDCKDNYLYPFFFSLIDNKLSNFFEIITLSKKENSLPKIVNAKLIPNSENSTFSISWGVDSRSIVQSFFVIRIKLELNNNCSMLYILKCKTCNGKQKQISEENSFNIIETLKKSCPFTKTIENYYEAVDSNILFHTNKIVPETMFKAQLYSFGLYTMSSSSETNAAYIKESFWRKYKVAVISVICIVCVLSVIWVVYMWFRGLVTKDTKEVDQEDSNKYYGEDDV